MIIYFCKSYADLDINPSWVKVGSELGQSQVKVVLKSGQSLVIVELKSDQSQLKIPGQLIRT